MTAQDDSIKKARVMYITRGSGYTMLYTNTKVTTNIFDGDYLVLATEGQAHDIQPGDVVQYNPQGLNFGWFVAKDGG